MSEDKIKELEEALAAAEEMINTLGTELDLKTQVIKRLAYADKAMSDSYLKKEITRLEQKANKVAASIDKFKLQARKDKKRSAQPRRKKTRRRR